METTVELLRALIPRVREGSVLRWALTGTHAEAFRPLADQITGWRAEMAYLRPAQLLQDILETSGLQDHYQAESRRLRHLEELVGIFGDRDDPSLHPETALRALVEFTSLARNVDYLADSDNRVVILTIHQAKGLEFDTVFIAGASEGEIPNYYAQSEEEIEEDRHLFYVAMTRAKERLHISSHQRNNWGYHKDPSPFIRAIDPRFLDSVRAHREPAWDEADILPF